MNAILLALMLSASAQSTGKMSPTSDVSGNRVVSASTSTAKALRDWVGTYDLLVNYPGMPGVSEIMARFVFPRAVIIPTGCTGSRASAGTTPTATATATIQKNGSNVGTITFNTDGTTSFTCAAPISLVAGDVLTVTAPSVVDLTLANLSVTLVGSM